MERNRSEIASGGSSAQRVGGEGEVHVRRGALEWWYRHFAPSGSTEAASLAQRERVRRGRTASIVMLIFMLFLLAILLLAIWEQDYLQAIAAGGGIGGSILALWLNRKGWTKRAGLLVLVVVYIGEILSLLVEPGGLTASNIFLLDYTVVPDVVVLAFFSANSLFPIVWLNVLLTWGLVVFGPHDATITNMLYRAPWQIFAHVYILQLIIASTLYLWARSTEVALQRADRAEEIVALEKRENERKQLELEQKSQLDTGIQQILQTLVDAANGDLNARTPLGQDHMLWQVSVALNNLIARLQSLSHTESELRQQIWEGNERVTDHHNPVHAEAGRTTGAQRALPPEAGRVTGAQRALPPEAGRVTGAQKALLPGAGRTTGAQRALLPEAGRTKRAQKAQHSEPGIVKTQKAQRAKSGITGQQPASKRSGDSRPETGGTGGRLRALRLEQDDGADQEKITRPVRGDITGEQEAVHPEQSNARDDIKKNIHEKKD